MTHLWMTCPGSFASRASSQLNSPVISQSSRKCALSYPGHASHASECANVRHMPRSVVVASDCSATPTCRLAGAASDVAGG